MLILLGVNSIEGGGALSSTTTECDTFERKKKFNVVLAKNAKSINVSLLTGTEGERQTFDTNQFTTDTKTRNTHLNRKGESRNI